ncbi:hypothetical protein ACJMK2_012429 [Sinanodonta woodiana]|uniref:Uncharacterized protein n=1 Tax=Sinanodonta woodiana TaxID=1069815 RepID=A0ABD3V877_SINWO
MAMMGLHDDIFYTTVEIPVESYPRIKYFQSELQDLYTRFERIFEKLPESVTLSHRSSVSISNAVQHLTNSRSMLFMFGPTHSRIPIRYLVQNDTPNQRRTHPLEDLHHLDIHMTNYRMVLAMCTLRMMDTNMGQNTLRNVKSLFGAENMMFYVDIRYELNMEMVVNTLADVENLLQLRRGDIKVVFESNIGIISNDINNHIENKFVNTFLSLNKFVLELTKKRSRTRRSTFGDKRTRGRFYRDIKRQFENVSTVIDLLVTSRGETTEQKLATAIVAFTKALLISEIAETYEMQDVQIFDYCQRQNFTDIWTVVLQEHLYGVPLVRIFDQLVRMPNDELARRDIENNYTLDDAKTIGREVTQALMGYFLELGTNVKEIRVNLDLLTLLRKELLRLIEETLVGDEYVERVPNLDNWRKQILGIRDVKKLDIVFGKLVVFVNIPESTEREKEVRKQVKKSLKGFPSEVVVECVSYRYHAGRHGNGTNSKIDMGDAFRSEGGSRGTIGLFMKEYGTEHMDLHFVTSSHAVVGSKVVKTNDQSPVLLGTIRHSLFTDDGLVDVAAIRVENEIRTRCNIFFKENDEIRKCKILDINAIQTLKEGKHVYKRGSTTGETKGCIISEDFSTGSGLKDHSFLVGLPVGSDEAALSKGFAQEGDSGAVLYTKAPDGEVQYVGLLMGKYTLRDETDSTSSTFRSLTKEVGSLILTTCLQEGLNRIEQKFNFKLALPTHEGETNSMKTCNIGFELGKNSYFAI